MTTYIAGFDGSDAGRQAVRLARQLASATGAEVVAAAVHPAPRHVHIGVAAAGEAEAALADEARARARELLDGLDEDDVELAAVPGGSPAEGLHRLAEERDAAMIVVGATHRGPAGRLVPGSVGERLVHGAPCPVLVVPADRDGTALERIGVAFDDRPESHGAVEAAVDLARRLGAKVQLLAVYEPVMAAYVAPGVPVSSWDYDDELRKELEQHAREVADAMPEEVRLAPRVMTGAPGRALAEAAEREDVQLLVTGSRGYGTLKSVLVGSVSRYLVDHAPCAVLVVPRTAAQPASPAGAVG